MADKKTATVTAIGGEAPTDGAREEVERTQPYTVLFTLEGSTDIIFHRWNCEAVAEKASASKGSKSKKTDNIESYVYRNDAGEICIPGEYVRGSIVRAAKFRQDPRSPRKSMEDLAKAALVPLTALASLGAKNWDYEDRRRVTVQRNGITRVRPAMKEGWKAEFEFMVNLPQYVSPGILQDLLTDAGRLVGIGDFRPTYGRFRVVKFEVNS